MELIDFCKSRYGRLFQALTMSRRSSARYLRLVNLQSLWLTLVRPVLVVLRWHLAKVSLLLLLWSDMVMHVPTFGLLARNLTAFRRFRTVCALIRRPWFSMILEAGATAVSVLFVIWDRIIFWFWCLVVTMCLGDLFVSETFPVIVTFRFNLRMVEVCLLNIAATLKSILRIIQWRYSFWIMFFKYLCNNKFPILNCSKNNVPVCMSTPQSTLPLPLTAHRWSYASSFRKLSCFSPFRIYS